MCAVKTAPVRLTKKEIEQLVEEKDESLSYSKPPENNRTSKYWSKFSQIYISNTKQDFIICDSCRTVLVYKSTTGSGCMLVHSRACEGKDKESNSSSQQQKLNDFYNLTSTNKKMVPKAIKKAITQSCVEFAVEDGRAFHVLQGSGFVSLAKQLFDAGKFTPSSKEVDIHDLLPDPTTISRNIDRIYVIYKEKLIKLCRSMDSYCLTVDFWTESYTGLSYCGLSLNHVDSTFQSYTFLLGCFPYEMENKRASTIRGFVDDILNTLELKLDEKKYVMTDNEPTMKATFSQNCKRLGCSDHYLNKQLQHTFTKLTIDGDDVNCHLAQEVFESVKQIVSTIRRMHKQQNLSKKLITYSDTRFSGAFAMLSVFLNVFDEIPAILDSNLANVFSNIDRDLLQEICKFLIPFDDVMQILSDNKRPTLHRVLPLKQLLINKCTINDEESEGLKQIKIFLKKRLFDKWQLSDEHLIATLIHPNLKNFHMCPNLREHAIRLLQQEMLNRQEDTPIPCTPVVKRSSVIPSPVSLASPPSSSSSPISKIHSPTPRKRLLMEIFDKKDLVPEKSTVQQELERYLASTTALEDEEDDDILSYWREHQHVFPLIASIARDILAIPASNTSVERLFSSCKTTISEKRTKLGSEKLNRMMFLQKNLKILKNFPIQFAANNTENANKINDAAGSKNESINKKFKPSDVAINHQDHNEDFIFLESNDDDLSLSF